MAADSVLTGAANDLHRPAYGGDLLIRGLARNPSKPAVYLGDRVLTSAEMADEISRWVQAYHSWGIGQGSPTAMLAANRPEVLFALGAGMVTGTRGTSLHPMGSLDDHAYILEDAGIDNPVDGLGTLAPDDPDRYAAGAQRLISHGYLPPSA